MQIFDSKVQKSYAMHMQAARRATFDAIFLWKSSGNQTEVVRMGTRRRVFTCASINMHGVANADLNAGLVGKVDILNFSGSRITCKLLQANLCMGVAIWAVSVYLEVSGGCMQSLSQPV